MSHALAEYLAIFGDERHDYYDFYEQEEAWWEEDNDVEGGPNSQPLTISRERR